MPDWSEILRNPPPELELVHELGLPDDPASIFGRERLSLWADGRLRLEWLQRGQAGAWTARVPPRLVRRFAAGLLRGGFPSFPAMIPRSGASFRKFEAHLGEEHASALLSRFDYEEEAPYEDLCNIADSLCAQVRGRPVYADPDPARGAVTGVATLG